MSDEFLQFVKTYGLPAWGVILIAAGTIVAAIITFIQAILVALINAWASQRVAIYDAHRVRRADEISRLAKNMTPCLTAVSYFRNPLVTKLRSHQAKALCEAASSKLEAAANDFQDYDFTFVPTKIYRFVQSFLSKFGQFEKALRFIENCETDDGLHAGLRSAHQIALDCLDYAGALENATDGYIYVVRRLSWRARWRIWEYRFRERIRRIRNRLNIGQHYYVGP